MCSPRARRLSGQSGDRKRARRDESDESDEAAGGRPAWLGSDLEERLQELQEDWASLLAQRAQLRATYDSMVWRAREAIERAYVLRLPNHRSRDHLAALDVMYAISGAQATFLDVSRADAEWAAALRAALRAPRDDAAARALEACLRARSVELAALTDRLEASLQSLTEHAASVKRLQDKVLDAATSRVRHVCADATSRAERVAELCRALTTEPCLQAISWRKPLVHALASIMRRAEHKALCARLLVVSEDGSLPLPDQEAVSQLALIDLPEDEVATARIVRAEVVALQRQGRVALCFCPVCRTHSPVAAADAALVQLPCGASMCRDCLTRLAEAALAEHRRRGQSRLVMLPRPMELACPFTVHQRDVVPVKAWGRGLLGPQLLGQCLAARRRRSVAVLRRLQRWDAHACPYDGCSGVVDHAGVVACAVAACPTCAMPSCTKCGAAHDAAHAARCPADQGESLHRAAYDDMAAMAAAAAAAGVRTVVCPRPYCFGVLNKADACNTVQCPACGDYLCWLCGKPLCRVAAVSHGDGFTASHASRLAHMHFSADRSLAEVSAHGIERPTTAHALLEASATPACVAQLSAEAPPAAVVPDYVCLSRRLECAVKQARVWAAEAGVAAWELHEDMWEAMADGGLDEQVARTAASRLVAARAPPGARTRANATLTHSMVQAVLGCVTAPAPDVVLVDEEEAELLPAL